MGGLERTTRSSLAKTTSGTTILNNNSTRSWFSKCLTRRKMVRALSFIQRLKTQAAHKMLRRAQALRPGPLRSSLQTMPTMTLMRSHRPAASYLGTALTRGSVVGIQEFTPKPQMIPTMTLRRSHRPASYLRTGPTRGSVVGTHKLTPNERRVEPNNCRRQLLFFHKRGFYLSRGQRGYQYVQISQLHDVTPRKIIWSCYVVVQS